MDSLRVLVGDKALRFAPTPHSGAADLDADSARARVANMRTPVIPLAGRGT